MKFRLSFVLIFLYTDTTLAYVSNSVKFNISSSDDIACAASNTDERSVGVRIQNGSQTCKRLDFDWAKDPVHEPGFKYVLKMATLMMYKPPIFLDDTGRTFDNVLQLQIPGIFTPGSKIELLLTRKASWEIFRFRITNSEEYHEAYPVPGVVILYQLRAYTNYVDINCYKNVWRKPIVVTGDQQLFTEGEKVNVTVSVTQKYYQTFIDGNLVCNFSHIADPQTARNVWISAHGATLIHSVGIRLCFSV